jgi:hypothetical protein
MGTTVNRPRGRAIVAAPPGRYGNTATCLRCFHDVPPRASREAVRRRCSTAALHDRGGSVATGGTIRIRTGTGADFENYG